MNKKTRNTMIMVAVIAVIAIVGLIVQKTVLTKPAVYAVVESDGKEVLRLDLSKDTTETVESPYGGYNVIQVKDGTVCVSESDCDNQICVHQGQISEAFEVICCLPHQLIVSIDDGSR